MKVFITGISRGIGLALTEAMLQEKMEVYGTVRNLNNDDMNGVKDLVKQFHQKLHLIKLDVTQENIKEQIVQHIPKNLTLDLLVNNAGVYHKEVEPALERLTKENLKDSINVNLVGPMLVTQALLPYLMNSENPKVANISSILGSVQLNADFSSTYDYRVSKAGLNMFSKNLSLEFPDMVTLNLHPGWVKTQMGGENAPIKAEASAKKLLKIILNSDISQSGSFYNLEGERLPW